VPLRLQPFQIDDETAARLVGLNTTATKVGAFGFGAAVEQYLLTHWEALTLFLFVPGAPLHNNVCERILKMAIRHRNNSLFYRSQRGAVVGDLFMTLIETTVENDENPFEYLTALQRHSKEVAERPSDWLPWTFRSTLA